MDKIISLPLPPSLNTYYARGKFISPAGKEYRAKVINAVRAQQASFKANIPIQLEIVVNFSDSKRKKDLDNFVNTKGLFDALTHAQVWEDDSLIKRYTVEEGVSTEKGSVLLTIQPYRKNSV